MQRFGFLSILLDLGFYGFSLFRGIFFAYVVATPRYICVDMFRGSTGIVFLSQRSVEEK